MNAHLQIAHDRDAAALRRSSTLEKLARARGNHEREASDANWTVLLEAENAWLRLQLAEMTGERDGWRGIVRAALRKARALKREQDIGSGA